ncbi:MAG: hypothetical protein R3253_00805 [Longimicrobiales bacterium]|nr:hypothetical protein [Longimicrobiales bacterium]
MSDDPRGDGSRRFTDQEVALVLKRATELDEAGAAPAAGGLSLTDLREIAREVGISPAAIDRAVATLDRGQRIAPRLAGAPRVRKAARAVPVELDQDAIARLMAVVDERTDSAGSITEALGSVRWTGRDRFKSTRVSVTPKDGETAIEVVEKAEPKMRRIFHLVPPAWALMLAGPFAAEFVASAAGTIGLIVLAVAVGIGVGRGAWTLVSELSRRRVQRLAEELADEAAR